MIDQFAVFTPAGNLLYGYNSLNKKFSETQINRFVSEFISQPVKDVTSKFPIISTSDTSYMYHETKQPHLFLVVSFASSESIQLTAEAESVVVLATKLWESLGLNEVILDNISGKGKKNVHNFRFITEGASDQISKFGSYFEVKYDEMKKTSQQKGKKHTANYNKQVPVSAANKGKQSSKGKKENSQIKARKWGRDGLLEETAAMDESLDFSEGNRTASPPIAIGSDLESDMRNGSQFGKQNDKGEFLINEIDELLASNKEKSKAKPTTSSPFSFLQKHILGNKTISEEDLKTVLDSLKQKLISKNVAPEVADHLCNQVSKDLIGSKTENWTSVDQTARESLQKCLSSILTPSVSVDLLHEIQKRINKKDSSGLNDPYVFSVVGVNGVGKSTNLSKLAFWLLKNNLKVLIVACDTFRSGAVEQLRVHVENLAQLTDHNHVRGTKNRRGKTGNEYVELFEGGYGGSNLVTKIAKQAIKYAKTEHFDVVLMDTAGRRHNDATLMSPLKSFAEQANPDKIIMVGEALVGTDSVQQAHNFNQAFGKERNLDFFIISKCDTVGELLGTMVNMVYATSIPILFIGVGQTYTDLRTLSVEWAVNSLLS
ncbi:Signal recognition particle receptor subunit alpha [Kluyveromyces lactis]|uniref:Signal recognition particle receptor subunit alpha homolog n=1 Tax=Kluyveromyces lactis (strain ATCC 8585 / CBS 2359 / DSM 70799 / NBRC 1267 / NRRL Y-1140 / WM37) TaxID=284590 RepID=Q6CTR2_KLULA|nr:uncharacterized protein KLLA0_C10714g [Kluyveromyces lactis]CAH01528.1 KLLA0C10714p [Kluyveromyces lactis]|eukprot:XP_452677.1 uncharacterized protein KLLA0_C10714g [Kluyveromyces lactis]